MKADAQTEKEVLAALNACAAAYEKRDMTAALEYFAPDPDVIQFGMSAVNAKRVAREGLKAEFESDWGGSEAASFELGWYSVSAAGNVAWVAADALFHWKEEGEPEEIITARLTVVFEKREGKWLWMHSHFSLPVED